MTSDSLITERKTGPPLFLAISGRSGAGKSKLAQRIALELAVWSPVVLALDNYYLDLSRLALEERNRRNFDHPAALDWELLSGHLSDLKNGKSIKSPIYDFSIHTRSNQTLKVSPGGLVVVEGLHSFYFRIKPLMDFRVFIDISKQDAFKRRMARDVEERGRDPASVARQYETQVEPAYISYLRPLKPWADLIVDGAKPIDLIAARVLAFLAERLQDPAGP